MIKIPLSVYNGLYSTLGRFGPREKCGFLGFRKGRLDLFVPVRNSSKSMYRFEVKFLDRMIGLARLCVKGELENIGFYHTHMTDSAKLSKDDEAEILTFKKMIFAVVTPKNLYFNQVNAKKNTRVIERLEWQIVDDGGK